MVRDFTLSLQPIRITYKLAKIFPPVRHFLNRLLLRLSHKGLKILNSEALLLKISVPENTNILLDLIPAALPLFCKALNGFSNYPAAVVHYSVAFFAGREVV